MQHLQVTVTVNSTRFVPEEHTLQIRSTLYLIDF